MTREFSQEVLAGLRVADFSRVLAGPYATMMLADFGADVIKVESPLGDETRSWSPPTGSDGQSAYFGSVNRNKRSVVCDFTTPEGLAYARELATSADVVIENFRPGVMSQFGLDYETLRESNPSLVYCSITGFGTSGRGSALAGYDLLVQALSGLMSITGSTEGPPTKVGVAVVDVLCGQNAVAGILLALRARDAHPTRHGQKVEVNLMSSALAALVNQAGNAIATGNAPRRLGNAHPSISPYELYNTGDKPIIIAVGNDKHFAILCELLDLAHLVTDSRFDTNPHRVANREALTVEIEKVLSGRESGHWVDTLSSAGLPVGPVNTIPEALEFATEVGLDPVATVSLGSRTTTAIRNPIGLGETPASYRLPAPLLGEHDNITWFTDERRNP